MSLAGPPIIALLSNPRSTGNRAVLPEVRNFVAANPNIFHYEVDEVSQIPAALRIIARMRPVVLAINGGDGTVQRALTDLHHGGHFDEIPPVAVLPNGKTNLIAADLGASGDALTALRQLVAIVDAGLTPYLVRRHLIALSDGKDNGPPVLGMFLGGAGLAEIIMFCRNKIYPLGFPNWVSHVLAFAALVLGTIIGARARWLPRRQAKLNISLLRKGEVEARFVFLMVTTLDKVLYGQRAPANDHDGALKFMAIEQRRGAMLESIVSMLRGRLGTQKITGLHYRNGDEIRIEGDRPSVILDGEFYQAANGGSIVLTPTAPVSFVKLAA